MINKSYLLKISLRTVLTISELQQLNSWLKTANIKKVILSNLIHEVKLIDDFIVMIFIL